MLVGTFHFAYYNLDAHQTKEEDQINILSPVVQKEMMALIEYISLFKPTKILVESGRNTGYLMHDYRQYQKNPSSIGIDERAQLGFRLMEKFQLDTLYGIDAWPWLYDLYDGADSNSFRPVLDTIYHDWDFNSDEFWSSRYDLFYDIDDSLSATMSLLEYFLWMNNRQVLERLNGAYLTGDFLLGDYRGADALSLHWYNRNLRIMRRIQQLTTSSEDRILVIIGQGHASILDFLFRCTPQYDYQPFSELKR